MGNRRSFHKPPRPMEKSKHFEPYAKVSYLHTHTHSLSQSWHKNHCRWSIMKKREWMPIYTVLLVATHQKLTKTQKLINHVQMYIYNYLHTYIPTSLEGVCLGSVSGNFRSCFRHQVDKPLPSVLFGSPFLVDLHKKENGEDRDFWCCGVGG